jgi:hypothetical protein
VAEGDVREAKEHYRRALALAADDASPLPARRAIRSVAALRAQEGCLASAVSLLALVLDPTWAWSFDYGIALRLMIELEHQLSLSVLAEAKARGQSISLHATVVELLQELKE